MITISLHSFFDWNEIEAEFVVSAHDSMGEFDTTETLQLPDFCKDTVNEYIIATFYNFLIKETSANLHSIYLLHIEFSIMVWTRKAHLNSRFKTHEDVETLNTLLSLCEGNHQSHGGPDWGPVIQSSDVSFVVSLSKGLKKHWSG